ncbi:MAG TPA: hypothetical protein PK055_02695 [Gammaproteobacteria bacterium]|nr:hypothetical protein [Gammaproteobacteria bacterium]HPI95314.1 hypothetical protein [Gammaproteobacteria bacterium]HPQ86548.1 hypothetical protein [Gammaproteobacteria bacterium]
MDKIKTCCDNIKWQFIQDAGHARGCEFTYGKCTNCGADLIHLFHTIGNDDGYYQIVSPEFISQMQSLESNELKQFMKNWYDSL